MIGLLLLYRGKEDIHSEIEKLQSNKYYKSRTVSVTSEVGLTTD